MKVLKATLALASVLAFSSAYAVESAAPASSQPSVEGSSMNSQTVQQHSEIKKDSKGVIKKKKSTIEEQNTQQALPESQQPAAGK